MVAVLSKWQLQSKAVVLWKVWYSFGCPVVVVVMIPNSKISRLYTGMFSTSPRAGSFKVGWCSPMSHSVFLGSLMVIAAGYPVSSYSAHYGPPQQKWPPQDVCDCSAASLEKINRVESLVERKINITLPHRITSFSLSHVTLSLPEGCDVHQAAVANDPLLIAPQE